LEENAPLHSFVSVFGIEFSALKEGKQAEHQGTNGGAQSSQEAKEEESFAHKKTLPYFYPQK